MKRWLLLGSTGLLVALAGCGSEATDVTASPDAAGPVPVATTSPSEPVAAVAPYWDSQRIAGLEAAKAQFTPPPEEVVVTADAAAVIAPAAVVQEPAPVQAPVAAPTPTPVPPVEPAPTPDGRLGDEAFLELIGDVLDRYLGKNVTTKHAIDELRVIEADNELTDLQQILLDEILQDLQLIFDREQQGQQGQWNIGDIKVPTLYEVRRQS